MGFNEKLLGQNEVVIHHMRTHIKALFGNIVILLVLTIGLVAYFVLAPDSWPGWLGYVIVGLYLLVALIFFFVPFLVWLTNTFTITSRRIITRTGIITKRGHDIPLYRISNVAYERDLIDRFFHCGTIVLETSADNPLYLHDIPSVERVHVELTELLFENRNSDGGRLDPGDI